MTRSETDRDAIVSEIREGVAVVRLNRPEAMNAFNSAMQDEVRATWRALRSIDDVHARAKTHRDGRSLPSRSANAQNQAFHPSRRMRVFRMGSRIRRPGERSRYLHELWVSTALNW